jgi:hypothetical protein
MAADYKKEWWPRAAKEKQYFQGLSSIEVVIQTAVKMDPINGRKPDHERRRQPRQLKIFIEALLQIKIEIQAASSFDVLYSLVYNVGDGIEDIGDLTIYDTAYRIGLYLRLDPELVYLHSGTAAGARALGFVGPTLNPKNLPKVLKSLLTPAQLEDCFCIYADWLAAS